MPGLEFVTAELAELERRGLLRGLRQIDGPQGRSVRVDGQWALNFSSNDYLGLAGDARLVAAAGSGLHAEGAGAGASRLISGNLAAHRRLEVALAQFHGRHAALLFNSGYNANVGVIAALVGRGDAVFSDELNHASIIDGCRLSRATVQVYPHGATGELERLLRTHPARRRLIVTETVFSMDGDLAPLRVLWRLAADHDTILMVDEAHAVGVLGPSGTGLAAELGVEPDVLVGTLGKAFGSFGAYAAGSGPLVRWLINRARSFVFTTALPPSVAACSAEAVQLVAGTGGDEQRGRLRERCVQLARGLRALGLAVDEHSPIFPLIVGDDQQAMQCTRRLLELGIYVQGIRPPTVPSGTARLRATVMATHTEPDIRRAVDAFATLIRDGLLPVRGAGAHSP